MAGVLNGKVAIVTGGCAGFGWATAKRLGGMGAAVVVQARRKEKLDELVKEIVAAGGKGLAVAGDASKEKDVEALLESAFAFSETLGEKRLDIVVVNAGRGLAGGLLSSDTGQWKEIFDTNVLGAAHLMRRAGMWMMEQGSGDIVVLSSAVGQNISPFSGFYGATNFAVGALAEAFRREACAKNVRVTTIKPGIVISEFQQVAGYTQDNFYRNIERWGKVLEPADVANAIGFVVGLPGHVHVNDLTVRPTKQDYP